MAETLYDIIIIGGGINGAGIAADAAGRGLSVALLEAEDLASGTSAWSSKLIHGGLRYLEYYEFRLVREALAEREVLLRMAPHLVTPLRFRMPHHQGLRPAWMIQAGLFLYDHLSKRVSLPASRRFRFGQDSVLKPEYTQGFEYSDCRVDDARLVVMNAKLAQRKGASILTRHRVIGAERKSGLWHVQVRNNSGDELLLQGRTLVNAAGPWVRSVLDSVKQSQTRKGVRLVKGSHIVVPRLHEGPEAYILQHTDGRIVFVIPYLNTYSLIGTTDVDYTGEPRDACIDEDEIAYLLQLVNSYFQRQLSPENIVWSFSGVRPLMQGEQAGQVAAKVTRDYQFELEQHQGEAPLLSIFGGKLTTYRKLAESALEKLKPFLPQMGNPWTETTQLPGGESMASLSDYIRELGQKYPFLSAADQERIASTYGREAEHWLQSATSLEDLGPALGALYAREIDYLVAEEWAQTLEDILWRRTKTGIGMTDSDRQALETYLQRNQKSSSQQISAK